MNFAEMVKINKYRLPDECQEHAGLYHQVADALATAKAKVDAANDKLKLLLAEVESTIRATWNQDADGKMTEAGVAAKVTMHKDVLVVKEEVRQLQAEVYTLEAARSAMEHRRSMLDDLTQLLIKGFYATPNGGAKDTDVATSDVRKMLKKRKEVMKDED